MKHSQFKINYLRMNCFLYSYKIVLITMKLKCWMVSKSFIFSYIY
ncbi:MAG: hypothetical protein BAJALOKI1v1_2290006 [Promethearchaeota archaeon]|nr:MAG: hypothetical protein BAJALOKI1v1_2290006 [Candidatus Lokiarchaeota archaeon]